MKTNFLSQIKRALLRAVLHIVPVILFPKLNVLLFSGLGYRIDKSARIYSSTQMMGNIDIYVGEGTFIGHQTLLTGGMASIHIGNNCDISDRVSIFCGSHEIDMVGPRVAGKGIGKDIVIGDGVWIGLGALIMPGVTIGNKAVIASGTVVHKDVAENCIVGGNPMRIIKYIE